MQGVVPRGIIPFSFCGECKSAGGWDGIGGQMVRTRTRLATAGKPHGTGTKTVNPGKAKLNATADKKIKDNSTTIVNALYKGLVEKGNATCAKLLFDLADGKIDCENPEVVSQLYSYATSLDGEPQLSAEEAVELEEKEEEAAAGAKAE